MKSDEMSFWDHLEELRRRILPVMLVFCAATAIAFFFSGKAIPFFVRPLLELGGRLIAVNPVEKFMAYLKIAMVAGLFAAFPLAAAQFALFVKPALVSGEKAMLIPSVLASFFLGLLGAAFSLFVLTPFAFGFFASFARGDGIDNLWSFGACVDLSVTLLSASVLAFQFPWLLGAAMKLGVVKVQTLVKYRRHVIVAVFMIAAVITPPDIFSQSVVALVLWALFEVTVLFGRIKGG